MAMADSTQVNELQNSVFMFFEEKNKTANKPLIESPKITEPFPVLDCHDISYARFYEDYLIKNRPCLFMSSITDHWNSRIDWIDRSHTFPKINFDFLRNVYGQNRLSVVECDRYSPDFEKETMYNVTPGECEVEMTIAEFLDYWSNYMNAGYPASSKLFYLKDWHILKDSGGYVPYTTPKYFQSDWLNEVWGIFDDGDDFIFCYMGPKDSWTPFHCDVYGSFSWSANIIGTKKWRIYPPGGENKFRNPKTKKLKYDYANPGIKDVDYYEVIQQAGEVIFIPSGWHHCVWNLEDTISINHNWMNASNVLHIWAKLKESLQEVKLEIADLRNEPDFPDSCQQILKVNHGMDYALFLSLLQTIEENRKTKSSSTMGPVHRNFDLYVLNLMQMTLCNDNDVKEL